MKLLFKSWVIYYLSKSYEERESYDCSVGGPVFLQIKKMNLPEL